MSNYLSQLKYHFQFITSKCIQIEFVHLSLLHLHQYRKRKSLKIIKTLQKSTFNFCTSKSILIKFSDYNSLDSHLWSSRYCHKELLWGINLSIGVTRSFQSYRWYLICFSDYPTYQERSVRYVGGNIELWSPDHC